MKKPHNFRPSPHKVSKDSESFKLTHFLRIISRTKITYGELARILFAIFVLSLFAVIFYIGSFYIEDTKKTDPTVYAKIEETAEVEAEIYKTKDVLKKRPDYAQAWLRLSTLYESIGNFESSNDALEEARKLNSDY